MACEFASVVGAHSGLTFQSSGDVIEGLCSEGPRCLRLICRRANL